MLPSSMQYFLLDPLSSYNDTFLIGNVITRLEFCFRHAVAFAIQFMIYYLGREIEDAHEVIIYSGSDESVLDLKIYCKR